MEKFPKENIEKESGPENIDSVIEKLLEKETETFQRYIELYGEPNEELDEKEYWVVQEANVGKDREQAKNRLGEFIVFLESEIAKKEQ